MHLAEDHDAKSVLEEVFVRSHAHGLWSVCLGESVILLTHQEEEAFRSGCEAACAEGGSRPLTILSGPSSRALPEAVQRQLGEMMDRAPARRLAAG